MRCQDLTRELAAPEGTPASAELAAHLASCPRCAEAARRSAQLDRIWEATRPAEPSSRDLDALWARASAALDVASSSPASAVIPFEAPARRRRRWTRVALIAAQAAALLVAATYLLRKDVVPTPSAVAAAPPRMSVDVDEWMVVRIDEEGHRVEILDESEQFARPSMADATPHDVFNSVESMATQ